MNAVTYTAAQPTHTFSDVLESTRDLLSLACPTKEDAPFFNHCMRLAKEMGMNWEEGLQYTVEQRQATGR